MADQQISSSGGVAAGASGASSEALRRYALIVESMTEGVSLSSEAGTIVYTNPAEDRMFGYRPGELIGCHVSVQNAYPLEENQRRVEEVIATLKSSGVWEGEWLNRRKDGSDFVTASRITSVTLDGATHWLCVQRDITAQRAAEAEHKASEQRLKLAIEGTGVGMYDLDLANGEGIWSDSAFRMLGYEPAPDRKGRFEMWLARVHPEDVHFVLSEHARAEESGELRMEFRIVRADTGETRWLSALGKMVPGAAGTRSVGTVLDTTERRRTEEALRESAARLDLAVTAHGIGIFDWNIGTGEVLWTRQEEELFGLQAGSFGGDIADWAASVLPEDLEPMNATMRAAMAERRQNLDFAFRIRRDGEVRWIEGSSRFLYADDGTPLRMVGTNMDATERRDAEEHQRLLVNELNHRVKNTLAIIQAIAQQSFKGVAMPDEVRHRFEARLAALSAAHDVLTSENWKTASILQIIEDAVRPYGGQSGRVVLNGPDLRLQPKTAVSLALAIHELGTNAAKYGALSGAEGRVDIAWAAADGRLKLSWKESGGPPVRPPAQRGFGTRMIERALAAELRGMVSIAFPPEGVVCTVDAPLEKPRLAD